MTSSIFCPLCQRKNKPDATHCIYCGVRLAVTEAESFTTERISKIQSAIVDRRKRCAQYLPSLPESGIAIFARNQRVPVVIEDVKRIIIGRHLPKSDEPVVDLAEFDAMALGVSRHHLQITRTNNVFTVVDLGSTNGTWLNQRRLIPGRPYPLHNCDELLLGQCSIFACLHAGEPVEEVAFHLRDSSLTSPQTHQFTVDYLGRRIMPFLKAMIEIQQICSALQGLKPEKVHINAVSGVKGDPLVFVNLDGGQNAVEIIQQHVLPWRTNNANDLALGPEAAAAKLQPELQELARDIIKNAAPDTAEAVIAEVIDRLLPPLTLVATSYLSILPDFQPG